MYMWLTLSILNIQLKKRSFLHNNQKISNCLKHGGPEVSYWLSPASSVMAKVVITMNHNENLVRKAYGKSFCHVGTNRYQSFLIL